MFLLGCTRCPLMAPRHLPARIPLRPLSLAHEKVSCNCPGCRRKDPVTIRTVALLCWEFIRISDACYVHYWPRFFSLLELRLQFRRYQDTSSPLLLKVAPFRHRNMPSSCQQALLPKNINTYRPVYADDWFSVSWSYFGPSNKKGYRGPLFGPNVNILIQPE